MTILSLEMCTNKMCSITTVLNTSLTAHMVFFLNLFQGQIENKHLLGVG